MDNLGDWLYILILVAVGISSLFSSAKKKKQTGQASQQSMPETEEHKENNPQKPKSFWELLEDMQKGVQTIEETHPPTPQPVITEKKKKTQEKKKKAPTPFPAYNSEGISAFTEAPSSQSSSSITSSEEEAYALSGESFRHIDELKKAVIYSEILNRKY
ncbi:MAG: hypothetical protein LBJ60_07485 [Tannerellaceae bacterium]|nr:hypothetical protein [Tannerellaceae bacterium]